MPAAFQAPPKIAMTGAALRASSAILLCFLGVLGALGESPLFWVVFGGAVVVVAATSGGGGSSGGAGGSTPRKILDAHYAGRREGAGGSAPRETE